MKFSIFENPIHLGLQAKSEIEPPINGQNWYVDNEK
jgi:hypothetical protein